MRRKYYGKYRAIVFDVDDPKLMGRVRVKIPSILGDRPSNWAIPVTPFITDFYGLQKDDIVWVEFEEGHIDRPLVVGVWWKERETPIKEYNDSYADNLKRRRIKTNKHTIDLVDKDGEEQIIITDMNNNKIVIDSVNNIITVESTGTLNINANNVNLGGANGKSVARVDDEVEITITGTTSSSGDPSHTHTINLTVTGKITKGSDIVKSL
ncbi:MAG: hypothetical protein H0Z24_05950 [Thermosipho sp. (in: Bacteria)]|nr:hypothetical protein [Thermosipho sp. (in: thermotogales)]